MDLLARTVQASLCVSHGIREDVTCYLVMTSDPRGKIIRFEGSQLRRFNPDERSTAALIKKALAVRTGSLFREATPGVSIRVGGLFELLQALIDAKEHDVKANENGEALRVVVLDEHGTDIRESGDAVLSDVYILSDHQNFSDVEKAVIYEEKHNTTLLSLGPVVLHADHAIVLLHNERDRRLCKGL